MYNRVFTCTCTLYKYTYMYMYYVHVIGLECLNLCSNFSLRSFIATPTLIFAHVQSKHVVNNVCMFQKSLGCVVGCFCFISQSCDANSQQEQDSTCHKPINQFWRLSIAKEVRTTSTKTHMKL